MNTFDKMNKIIIYIGALLVLCSVGYAAMPTNYSIFYALNTTAPANAVTDYSLNGFDGTAFNGFNLINDTSRIGGGYYSLDGVDGYVQEPNTNWRQNNGSFVIILNTTNITSSAYDIISPINHRFHASVGASCNVGTAGDYIMLRMYDSGAAWKCTDTVLNKYVSSGEWVMFTFTWQTNGLLKLYINNALINSTAVLGTNWGASDKMEIGKPNVAGGSYFDGNVDVFLWYDYEMTAQDVADTYQELLNHTTGNITATLNYPTNKSTLNAGLYNGSVILTLADVKNYANCNINDTSWSIVGNTNLTNGTVQFQNDAPILDDNISLLFACNDTLGNWDNFTVWFYLNTVLNITFMDEETNTLLDFRNIGVIVVWSENGTNYTVTTGYLDINYLSFGTYTLVYETDYHAVRSYPLIVNQSDNYSITLYLINQSIVDSIPQTLYDSYGNELEGYNIRALKLINGQYPLVEICTTDFEGSCDIWAETYTPSYKFIIEKDGVIYKSTTASEIQGAGGQSFWINLDQDYTSSFRKVNDLLYAGYFNDNNNTFTLTYTDTSNSLSEICLKIYSKFMYQEESLYNQSCLTTASGTINLGVTPVNETTYYAKAYASFSPEEYFDLWVKEFFGAPSVGRIGLFYTYLIVAGIGIAGIWFPVYSLIGIPIAFFVTKLANLHTYSNSLLVSITAVGFILAYLIWRRG